MTGYKNILKPKSRKEIKTSMERMSPGELLKISTINGFLDGVKNAVERGANHVISNDALMESSFYGHYDIVKLLLDNGANVHVRDDGALRLASEYGHMNIVKLLLENGADVHARDDYALRLTSQFGHYDIVEILIENGADIDWATAKSS